VRIPSPGGDYRFSPNQGFDNICGLTERRPSRPTMSRHTCGFRVRFVADLAHGFRAAALLFLAFPFAADAASVNFDNDCGGKTWHQQCTQDSTLRTNWDNESFPSEGDDVTIGAKLGPVVAGAESSIRIKSLNAPGGLRLGDGTNLYLSSASAVNGLTWFRTSISTTASLVLSGNSEWGPSAILTGTSATGRIRTPEHSP
jgi:hypothetical protein